MVHEYSVHIVKWRIPICLLLKYDFVMFRTCYHRMLHTESARLPIDLALLCMYIEVEPSTNQMERTVPRIRCWLRIFLEDSRNMCISQYYIYSLRGRSSGDLDFSYKFYFDLFGHI